MSAASEAFGIVSAAIPLEAGFIVLNAINKTVKCTTCGARMHARSQKMHAQKKHGRSQQHLRHVKKYEW